MQRLILSVIVGYLLRRYLKSFDNNITQLSDQKAKKYCSVCRKSINTTFLRMDHCIHCSTPLKMRKQDESKF